MRFASSLAACVPLLLLLMSGCGTTPPAVTADQLQESLQGRWSIVRSIYDGKDVSKNGTAGAGVEFDKGSVKLIGSVIDQPLRCTYDVSTHPHRITMQPELGEPFLQGIIDVSGSKMRLCYRMHAKKELGFPQSFDSIAGSGLMLIEGSKAAP